MDEVAHPPEGGSVDDLEWYVYDGDGELFHVAESLPAAEKWALHHWEAVEVAPLSVTLPASDMRAVRGR